jgi:Ca-activated chloride channel family protein
MSISWLVPLQHVQRSFRAGVALLAALPLVPLNPGAGDGAVAGRVTDKAGNPVPHAQVIVVGTSLSSVTDARGGYRIARVAAGAWTLRASLVGYVRAEATGVQVVPGRTTMQHFVLEASTRQLQEITSADASGQRAEPRGRDEVRKMTPPRAIPQGVNRPNGMAQGATGFHGGQVQHNTEDYRYFKDNGFKQAGVDPLSTFAIDVDGASYANVRRFLTTGQKPPADAVRIEELVNYFPYNHEAPTGRDPFGVTTSQMPAPWAPAHRLVMVGIQGKRIEAGDLPPANLVFLLDVSGSMQSADKLPLVKRAFRLLVDQLRPQDRVAIVVYAGAAGLVLPSTPGSNKTAITSAIEQLEAGGSTAGGAGIKLAYDIAKQNFIAEGNNRVILATDGDFNVGVSSEGELVRLIEERKKEGTFLTVLGFGTGNLKDSRMEALANKGNGHYAYVDDILEARKVFVAEMGGTLLTIAKDVKIQVEFNPARVSEYRLIGYENRMLEHQDFNDDTKDGGELGAGHTVTAIYEVVPSGVERAGSTGVDPLKYRKPAPSGQGSGELATVKLRYQPPAGSTSQLITRVVRDEPGQGGTESLRFAAAVVQYGMLLRNSDDRGSASWDGALNLAKANMGRDPGGYRSEFVRLVDVARGLYGEVETARADETGAE